MKWYRQQSTKSRVIGAYKGFVVKAYCTIRFRIMNMRILDEIGQYLPTGGRILDVGCGFGLFTLYYSILGPERRFHSLDINSKRIDLARAAARELDLESQTDFRTGNAARFDDHPGLYDACYMLDIIHHLPRERHRPLLEVIWSVLAPTGILIVKDIATRPRWQMWFTWILDIAMSPRSRPNYVHTADMRRLLEEVGFTVEQRPLFDILPYPHVLYICRKTRGQS